MTDSTVSDKEAKTKVLTTTDNPYNPHIDYGKWKQWDQDNGYYTEEYVASLAALPFDVDEEEVDEKLDEVYQEILKVDLFGVYILI